MGALDILRDLGGCVGGHTIYFAAKALALAGNINRRDRKLSSSTKRKLNPLFPDLNLNSVELNINAWLPAEWFRDGVAAMTFGYKIIFKRSNIQNKKATKESIALLVHELVHVDQIRRMGESIFACEYGKGYLEAGSYEDNPLEVEAYEMQAAYLEGRAQPIVRKPQCIANTRRSSRELHLSSCYYAIIMKRSNRREFYTVQEGLDAGFDGCYYCLRGHHTH